MFTYSTFSEKSLTACRYLAIATAIAAPMSTFITGILCALMLITLLISGQTLSCLKIAAAHPVGKMLLLFFAWLILSACDANTPWGDRLTTLSSWKKLFYTFVLLGLFYQVYWQRLFVHCYLIVMTVAAVLATILWLTNINLFSGNIRGAGVFMTNYSAQSMAFVAATVCAIFLLAEPCLKQKKYWLLGAIILFTFNVFFISSARSGYVAFLVAIIVASSGIYGFKKLPQVIGAVSILIVIVALTSTTLQQRVARGLDETTTYQTSKNFTSVGIRIIFLKNTLELIKQRPMFGFGTSSFKPVYAAHVANKYADWRNDPTADPHNQYLFVWVENGLIGVLLFLAYIGVAVRQGFRSLPYGGMAASFLLAVCATSLFNSHFKTFPEGHLLAFFIGILLSSRQAEMPGKIKPDL